MDEVVVHIISERRYATVGIGGLDQSVPSIVAVSGLVLERVRRRNEVPFSVLTERRLNTLLINGMD